jgi:hypothetical protein
VAVADVVLADVLLGRLAHSLGRTGIVEQPPHLGSERGQTGWVGQQDAGVRSYSVAEPRLVPP